MNGSEQMKGFEDPLFSRVSKSSGIEGEAKAESRATKNIVGLIVLVAALCALAYYVFEAQQRIDQLNVSLIASQSQLSSVTQDLGSSQEKIETLETGLSGSQSKLRVQAGQLNHYKGLYTELKSEQTQQSHELESMSIEKANQREVDALKEETAHLKVEATEVKQQVGQAHSEIGQLREMSTRNRSDIENNREGLTQVSEKASSTAGELSAFKKSLEREYYNFELQEKTGIMKLFGVYLRMKNIDFRRQRYELEIMVGRKRIKRKDQYLNEPIYFYVEGTQKPYEIVVTKLTKEFAVGYLSVPKS